MKIIIVSFLFLTLMTTNTAAQWLSIINNALDNCLHREELLLKKTELNLLKKGALIDQEKYQQELAEIEYRLLVQGINCLGAISELAVNILKSRHDLLEGEFLLELLERQLIGSRKEYEAGRLTSGELAMLSRRFSEASLELEEKREQLDSLLMQWQSLIGDKELESELFATLEYAQGELEFEQAQSFLLAYDQELQSLYTLKQQYTVKLQQADPYFHSALDKQLLALEKEKVILQIKNREDLLRGQLEQDYNRLLGSLRSQQRLIDLISDYQQDLSREKLRYERGLSTEYELTQLQLQVQALEFDLLKAKLTVFLNSQSIYLKVGQAELWWQQLVKQREGWPQWSEIAY